MDDHATEVGRTRVVSPGPPHLNYAVYVVPCREMNAQRSARQIDDAHTRGLYFGGMPSAPRRAECSPPGRPRFGSCAKRSTAASSVVAVRAAAPGFSWVI